jgi:hypothetical protein
VRPKKIIQNILREQKRQSFNDRYWLYFYPKVMKGYMKKIAARVDAEIISAVIIEGDKADLNSTTQFDTTT